MIWFKQAIPQHADINNDILITSNNNSGRPHNNMSNASTDPTISFTTEEPLYYETHIEIYEEETQEKVFDNVLTDTNFCSTLLDKFNECFDRACNEYPAYDASAADRKTRTKYRVLVQMKSFATDNPSEILSNIKICYPYGHTSDIYAFARDDPFGDYLLKGGHSFIILIDEIVVQHIPQT